MCRGGRSSGDLVPLYGWLASRGRLPLLRAFPRLVLSGIEVAAIAVPLSAAIVDHGVGIWLVCLLGWWPPPLAWIDIRRWLLPTR